MDPGSAQLFRTCLIDTFFQDTNQAVIATLEATGISLTMPEGQTCCGQPPYNAGFWDEAIQIAKHTIQILEASSEPVVIPSGSCTHMIRHGYPRLFKEDPAWLNRAQALASRCFEWSEFIVNILGVDGFHSTVTGTIAYHPSCHLLRGLGVDDQPRQLLQNSFEASRLHWLPEDCCGFGGVFAVDFPELSTAMLDKKTEIIASSGVNIVTGCDMSCLMQIEGRLRRLGSPVRCAHLSELFSQETMVHPS